MQDNSNSKPRIIRFIRAQIATVTPLKVSSGQAILSDADLLVDAAGNPYIPATALAGVMRHYLQHLFGDACQGADDCPTVCDWFGYIKPGCDEAQTSAVSLYDARLLPQTPLALVRTRDGVALDAFKTVKKNAKYDYQIAEAGLMFDVRMRIDEGAAGNKGSLASSDELLELLLCGIQSGDIRIGGKTSRGYGLLKVLEVNGCQMDLSTAEGVESYVSFDWNKSLKPEKELMATIQNCEQQLLSKGGAYSRGSTSLFEIRSQSFAVDSFLAIRDYRTQAEDNGNDNGKPADATALAARNPLEPAIKTPVIPGTSWAGAFRAHMEKILKRAGYQETDAFLERVFGRVSLHGDERAIPASIFFDESTVQGASLISRTRNAVDRFTGGAADRKLFTNEVVVDGTLTLTVRWRKSISEGDQRLLENLVDLCFDDLGTGMLAVGGMTSIGSGILRPADKVQEGGN